MRYLDKSFTFAATQGTVSDADWAQAFARRPPLRIVLLGHSFIGNGCLRALLDAQRRREVRVEAVHGYLRRSKDADCPNVLSKAQAAGLRVFYHDATDPNLAELLTHEADVLISAGWGRPLSSGIHSRFPLSIGFRLTESKNCASLALFRLSDGERLAQIVISVPVQRAEWAPEPAAFDLTNTLLENVPKWSQTNTPPPA